MTKRMKRVSWVVVSLVVLVCLAVFGIYRIGSGISASVEHKTAKTATATVVSVTPIQRAGQPESSNKAELVRVCYEIDNFDQVKPALGDRYRLAEAKRLSIEGPRCKTTSHITLARNIRLGDKLSIVYLLENQNQIDVVAVTALGEEL